MRIAPLKNGVYKIDLKYRFLILNHFLYQLYTCQKKNPPHGGFFFGTYKAGLRCAPNSNAHLLLRGITIRQVRCCKLVIVAS